MKKLILLLAGCTMMTGALLTSCNTSSNKVDEAQEAVIKSKQDLEAARQEFLADMETFRKETATRIAANDQRIAELNANIVHERKEARADYKKRIAALEQKNRDMKKTMDDYKEEGKENWERFKTEFNHDMDALGQAFKDIGVRNTN
jgi:peptidoglycan hydrolase CwlO-like protein